MMSWWHHWLIISRLKDRLLITRVPSFSASELLGGRGFDGCGLYAPTYSRQSSQRIIPYLEVIVPVLMKFVKSEDDELKESCLQVSNFLFPPSPSLSLPPSPSSPSLSLFLLILSHSFQTFEVLVCFREISPHLNDVCIHLLTLCNVIIISLSLSLSFFR